MNAHTATDQATALAALGEKYFETQHTYDPYNATLLGIPDFDDLPGDPSLAASERAAADLGRIGEEVEAIDAAVLDEEGVVDRGVLATLVRGAQQDAEHSLWAANASAKGYVSRQGLVFQAVPAMTAADAESADRYLARLSGLAAVFDAIGERYAVEASRGRVPTRMGVDHSIQQLAGYLGLGLDSDVLLDPARRSGDAATLESATATVENEVRPAMGRLAERLRVEFLPDRSA